MVFAARDLHEVLVSVRLRDLGGVYTLYLVVRIAELSLDCKTPGRRVILLRLLLNMSLVRAALPPSPSSSFATPARGGPIRL